MTSRIRRSRILSQARMRRWPAALRMTLAASHSRPKGLAPQLRNLEIDLAGAGLQRPLIAASTGILPSLAAFVASCSAKLVCFRIQQGVQRLLDSPADISPK